LSDNATRTPSTKSASTNGFVRSFTTPAARARKRSSIHRTYFINGRGDEAMGTFWSYLDMTALGRQELWEDSPEGYPQTKPYEWQKWHDSLFARR
jgi:predicted dithiol-disulfide oxidoreductase (DUF899 family)